MKVKKKKRRLKKKFVIFLSVYFVLLASFMTISTFSKYSTIIEKNDSISIAKWSVEALDSSSNTVNVVPGNTSKDLDKQSYVVTVTSNSEVSNKYYFKLTNVLDGLKVILDNNAIYEEENNEIIISNVGYFSANDTNSSHRHTLTFLVPVGVEEGSKSIDLDVIFTQTLEKNTFDVIGPCTFYGSSSNVTGENCKAYDGEEIIDYTNGKYIDTGLYLFSENNKNKDFEVSFTIDSISSYVYRGTIFSLMDESGSPWPGIVFRTSNADTYEFAVNITTENKLKKTYPITLPTRVIISRRNNKVYIKINDEDELQTLDFSSYTGSFNYPITLGAGLDANMMPQRQFKGTISNIKIKID